MACNILSWTDEIFLVGTQSVIWWSVFRRSYKSDPFNETKKKKRIPRQPGLTVIDHIIGALLIFTLIITIIQRWNRDVVHWLLQPCHIMTTFLIFVVYDSSNDIRKFKMYLYTVWMPWFGILFGDLSFYDRFGEVEMFWLQHVLLTGVPFYYLFNKRFHQDDDFHHEDNWKYFLFGFSISMMYHIYVLLFAGRLFNTDYDSMSCPPVGLDKFVGKFWREAAMVASFILAFIFSYLPELFVGYFHKFFKNEKKNNENTILKKINKKICLK